MEILAYQISVPETNTFRDKCDHVQRIARTIERRFDHAPETALVVLPELSVIDYSAAAFDRLDVLAEDLRGFSFQCFSDLADKLGCAIAYGFPRKSEAGYHICHAVVGKDKSLLAHYDKIHLAQLGDSGEKPYFTAGNGLCILEIDGFTIVIIICYDIRFPQLTSVIQQKYRPDVFIHPVAFTRDATRPSWHHFAITRAIENQAYFLSLNRAGKRWGNSIFCPPWLDGKIAPVVFGDDEELSTCTVDAGLLEEIRKKYPLGEDRLDDYSIL